MWKDIATFTDEELDAADAPYERWARRLMEAGEFVAWVVEEDGEVAASGAVWLQPTQPRPAQPFEVRPYLLSMCTEVAHRKRGHAERIVCAAMAWARERGHPFMALHASEYGRPLYERLGFERTWEMRNALEPRREKEVGRAR